MSLFDVDFANSLEFAPNESEGWSNVQEPTTGVPKNRRSNLTARRNAQKKAAKKRMAELKALEKVAKVADNPVKSFREEVRGLFDWKRARKVHEVTRKRPIVAGSVVKTVNTFLTESAAGKTPRSTISRNVESKLPVTQKSFRAEMREMFGLNRAASQVNDRAKNLSPEVKSKLPVRPVGSTKWLSNSDWWALNPVERSNIAVSRIRQKTSSLNVVPSAGRARETRDESAPGPSSLREYLKSWAPRSNEASWREARVAPASNIAHEKVKKRVLHRPQAPPKSTHRSEPSGPGRIVSVPVGQTMDVAARKLGKLGTLGTQAHVAPSQVVASAIGDVGNMVGGLTALLSLSSDLVLYVKSTYTLWWCRLTEVVRSTHEMLSGADGVPLSLAMLCYGFWRGSNPSGDRMFTVDAIYNCLENNEVVRSFRDRLGVDRSQIVRAHGTWEAEPSYVNALLLLDRLGREAIFVPLVALVRRTLAISVRGVAEALLDVVAAFVPYVNIVRGVYGLARSMNSFYVTCKNRWEVHRTIRGFLRTGEERVRPALVTGPKLRRSQVQFLRVPENRRETFPIARLPYTWSMTYDFYMVKVRDLLVLHTDSGRRAEMAIFRSDTTKDLVRILGRAGIPPTWLTEAESSQPLRQYGEIPLTSSGFNAQRTMVFETPEGAVIEEIIPIPAELSVQYDELDVESKRQVVEWLTELKRIQPTLYAQGVKVIANHHRRGVPFKDAVIRVLRLFRTY